MSTVNYVVFYVKGDGNPGSYPQRNLFDALRDVLWQSEEKGWQGWVICEIDYKAVKSTGVTEGLAIPVCCSPSWHTLI